MKPKRFRCRCCQRLHPMRVRDQKYCGSAKCQQARRNAWYREKCAGDPDYRANQKQSTQAWLESKGGAAAYYREYRKRRKQAQVTVDTASGSRQVADKCSENKDHSPDMPKSANIDAISEENAFKSGRYLMIPEHAKPDANIDAILVEIAMISSG